MAVSHPPRTVLQAATRPATRLRREARRRFHPAARHAAAARSGAGRSRPPQENGAPRAALARGRATRPRPPRPYACSPAPRPAGGWYPLTAVVSVKDVDRTCTRIKTVSGPLGGSVTTVSPVGGPGPVVVTPAAVAPPRVVLG
jgi:hypothetical protein